VKLIRLNDHVAEGNHCLTSEILLKIDSKNTV